jgi:putative glutathione S-transferase
MGKLIDGVWSDEWYDTKSTGGRFERKDSAFRDFVRANGSTRFAPESGRYHLYISLACPWAHRTLIFRKLKGLEDAISLSIVDPYMGENGWEFGSSPGTIADSVNGAKKLHEIYTKADPHYTGRVTVPVLWDRKLETIVSNESAEIIRMFNTEFDSIAQRPDLDYYPETLRTEIDAAYEEAFSDLFSALDRLEELLGQQRYVVGDQMTEADWRLFTTLVRFDAVYVGHFKCNLRRIADMPNIHGYLRELYQVPGVAETVNLTHIKRHYYESHGTINPTGIVPVGPELDLDSPHGRS